MLSTSLAQVSMLDMAKRHSRYKLCNQHSCRRPSMYRLLVRYGPPHSSYGISTLEPPEGQVIILTSPTRCRGAVGISLKLHQGCGLGCPSRG